MAIINLIWMGDYKKKVVTVQWKAVCKPLEEQGLGIRSLTEFNETAMVKLAWYFIKGKNCGVHS